MRYYDIKKNVILAEKKIPVVVVGEIVTVGTSTSFTLSAIITKKHTKLGTRR